MSQPGLWYVQLVGHPGAVSGEDGAGGAWASLSCADENLRISRAHGDLGYLAHTQLARWEAAGALGEEGNAAHYL